MSFFREMVTQALVGVIRLYQLLMSPIMSALGARCRFYPSCSAYAVGAIVKDGPVRGTMRAIRRVLRCQPWHPGGFDPP